jgi:hypothetical protein
MSFKKPVASLIAVAIMAAFSGSAVFAADSTTTTTTTSTSSGAASGKLVSTYSTFAGSDANSKALVDGLRNGTSITLKSSGTGGTTTGGTTGTTGGTTSTTSGSVTFTPKTSKLGFGNVNIALALAQAELTKMGITNPTPAQIEAALNGGTITTATGSTKVTGILAQRADGKGWGQIAKSLGFNLGQVVAASKTDKPAANAERRADAAKDRADAKAAKADARAEKVEKVAKVDKMEKPQKIDRPEKIDRPVKVERPERAERPQK